GAHTFRGVVLTPAGTRTITATDNAIASITGSASVLVNPASATSLSVSAPASTTAGSPFSITVTAKDAYNNVATGYLGTVGFAGGGTGATLPGTYTFTAGDAGAHTFGGVILTQAGPRTITLTDLARPSSARSASVPVTPAGATSLTVSAPASTTAGSPFSITVTAKDAYN